MAKRVLFTPWEMPVKQAATPSTPHSPGEEYMDKNNFWIRQYKANQATKANPNAIFQVWYGPNAGNSSLCDLGADDQVYIRGHCFPGMTCIYAKVYGGHYRVPHDFTVAEVNAELPASMKGHALFAGEVVIRLLSMGLKPEFPGTIKCYNCNSAVGDPNFASAVKQELRNRGADRCTVIGYRGSLESSHASDGHKHTTYREGMRASDDRARVTV